MANSKKVPHEPADTLSVGLGRFAVSGKGRGVNYVPLIVAMFLIAMLVSTVVITISTQSVAERLRAPAAPQKVLG